MKYSLLILILFNTLLFSSSTYSLTKEESEFLKDHKTIKVGYSDAFEPAIFKDENGVVKGWVVDLYEKLGNELGVDVEYRVDSWKNILDDLQTSQIDVIPDMAEKLARRNGYLIASPLSKVQVEVFVNKKSTFSINSLKDLKGLKLAYNRNIIVLDKFLQKYKNEITLVPEESSINALKTLASGSVDVALDFSRGRYLISKYELVDLKATHILKEIDLGAITAVNKNLPLLQSILNKALSSVTIEEKKEILENWYGKEIQQNNSFELTQNEKEYLTNNKNFTVCDQYNIYPISGINDGKLVGIVGDIYEEISKKLGIDFHVIESSSAKDLNKKVSEGRCAFVSVVIKDQKRFSNIVNSEVAFDLQLVSLGNLESFYIDANTDLRGHTFIVRGPTFKTILSKAYPDLKVIVINDIKRALEKIQSSTKFHFALPKPLAERVILEYGFDKFKINGVLEKAVSQETLGVNNNLPIMLSIINKTIKSMDEKIITKAFDKYAVKEYKQTSFAYLWYVVAIAIFVAIMFFYRTRLLKRRNKEINEVNRQLEDANDELDAQYRELQKTMLLYTIEKEKFHSFMTYASDGIFVMSLDTGKLLDFSNQVSYLLGYTTRELRSLSVMDWDKDIQSVEEYQQIIESAKLNSPITFERVHTRKDGTTYVAAITAVRIRLEDNEVLYASVRDITKEKKQNLAMQTLKNTLSNAVTVANLGAWEWDAVNDITTWSDITYEIYGVDKSKDINLGVIESIIFPEDLQLHRDKVINSLEKRVSFDFQYRVVKNQQIRTIHAIGNPIIENNIVVRLVGVVQDITDFKETEMKLQKAKEQFQNMFIKHSAIMLLIDPTSGRFIDVNQSAIDFYGYSKEEFLNLSVADINTLSPEDVSKKREEALKKKEAHFIFEHKLKNGREVLVDVNSTPITTSEGTFLFSIVKDISKQKELENLYKDLYENSPDMMVSVDPNSAEIIKCNQTVANKLGYSKEELLGKKIFEVYHPDCMEDVKKAFECFISTGEVKSAALILQKRNGEKVEVILNVSAVRDDDGNILYSRSSWIDITEDKKQQVLLESLKNTLSNAVNIAHLGTWEWDIIKDSTSWSKITYNVFGVEENINVDLKLFESLIHPDDLEHFREKIGESLEKRTLFDIEYRIIKNGEIRNIHATGNPIIKKDTVVKMVGVVQDVTDLKEHERKLLKAQQVAKLGIWEFDNVTGELIWSDEIFSMFELDKEKFQPSYEAFFNVIHQDDREMVEKAYLNSLESKEQYKITHRLKMGDGRIKWVEEQCETKFDSAGKPLKSLGTVYDITTELLLKEELEKLNDNLEEKVKEEVAKVEELQKQNLQNQKKAAMGDLIGIIAHQLKQPLNGINLSTSIIEDSFDFGELTAEELDKMTKQIYKQVNFMAQSIDDLRNFFRPDKLPQPFSIKKAIEKGMNIIERNISSKGINIEKEFREDATIIGIESELQQVIINIVNNAKDILLENNSKEKLIKISTRVEEKNAVIEIEDTGGGIPTEILEKVFESYFTTKGEKGTGIGLNLAKMIVEDSMGGKISVKNSGKGAFFTIILPLNSK